MRGMQGTTNVLLKRAGEGERDRGIEGGCESGKERRRGGGEEEHVLYERLGGEEHKRRHIQERE